MQEARRSAVLAGVQVLHSRRLPRSSIISASHLCGMAHILVSKARSIERDDCRKQGVEPYCLRCLTAGVCRLPVSQAHHVHVVWPQFSKQDMKQRKEILCKEGAGPCLLGTGEDFRAAAPPAPRVHQVHTCLFVPGMKLQLNMMQEEGGRRTCWDTIISQWGPLRQGPRVAAAPPAP